MLHVACIVGRKPNYKQRHYVAFVLANTSNVFYCLLYQAQLLGFINSKITMKITTKLLQDTLNNALFTHASSILSQLKRSYGTECHAWLLEEAKNILVIAEQYDIQNGTEFTMLSDKIKKN
jgi:hypothetical protein